MNTDMKSNGERALDAALAELAGANECSAAIVVFFAAARHLGVVFDRQTAGGLAYMMADELATGVRR